MNYQLTLRCPLESTVSFREEEAEDSGRGAAVAGRIRDAGEAEALDALGALGALTAMKRAARLDARHRQVQRQTASQRDYLGLGFAHPGRGDPKPQANAEIDRLDQCVEEHRLGVGKWIRLQQRHR